MYTKTITAVATLKWQFHGTSVFNATHFSPQPENVDFPIHFSMFLKDHCTSIFCQKYFLRFKKFNIFLAKPSPIPEGHFGPSSAMIPSVV